MSSFYDRQILPRLIGPARAKEMALLGESIGARRAEAMGLINAVYGQEELLQEVYKRARHLADRSASAISLTKRMMNRAFESSMEAVLDDEHYAQSFLFSTEANRRGVDRFLSARNPNRNRSP